jgi:hypothetical protein
MCGDPYFHASPFAPEESILVIEDLGSVSRAERGTLPSELTCFLVAVV